MGRPKKNDIDKKIKFGISLDRRLYENIKKDGFMVNNNRLFGKIGLSLMESWKMFEIDSFEDLELCEIIFENKIR